MRIRRVLPVLLPLAVGAVSLAITAGLWRHEQRGAQQALRADFDLSVRQTAGRIEQRMASYEQMLRGVQGLYQAVDQTERRDFSTYVDTLLAGADYSGVQWFAYAPWRPDAASGGAARILQVAPAAGLNLRALGEDALADDTRRGALQLARDSGGLAITPRLLLPADASGKQEPGFVMVLPVYARQQPLGTVAARRAAIAGWVLAAVRMGDLMSSLYGEGTPGVETRVHDGVEVTDATLMYSPGPKREGLSPAFEAREYIGFAGHSWTIDAQALPEFEHRPGGAAATIMALSGIGLSLVLALLTYQLATGRQRAHEAALRMTVALRASEERYRRIVETADEGIWVTDADGRTVFANPKMAQMLGLTAEALLGRPMAEFIEPDNVAGAVVAKAMGMVNGQTIGTSAAGDQHGGQERRLRRADGSRLWALVATTPIVDTAGRFDGSLAMVTDITPQKQAEIARAELEVQLRASQKMEAIGTLAGGIAHDFNNILAAILGNVVLAQREPMEPVARSRLGQIKQSAEQARGLVQQILAFSRRQPHSLKRQPLAPVVEESVRLLRPLLPAMVELELVLPDAPMTVQADATQLHQVLMNLCTNAWHAMNGAAGRIEVRLDRQTLDDDTAQRRGLQSGPHAHLAVIDNGCGMNEATRQRLFEPFFTTKPVGQGTGLGLAVVHGIVSAHQGAIGVTSTPGRGTHFDLYFPLQPDLPEASATAAAGPPQAAPAPDPHVMYLDDDPVMVVMVEGLLRHAGYRVTTFEDPREAMARLRARPAEIDLVVTDFNMPGLSGLEVAGELASLRPGLPVVISSGYVTEALLDAAARVGVRSVMQKEFTLEQLPALLRRLLAEPSATV